MPSCFICMQTGMFFAAACSQNGNVFGSANHVAWSGSVLPLVNSRMPLQPRASQPSNVLTASAAKASSRAARALSHSTGQPTPQPLRLGLPAVEMR